MDYLQVFDLKALEQPNIVENQIVIHSSEKPVYKQSYSLVVDKRITTKVYVIDSAGYCTMLLAREC